MQTNHWNSSLSEKNNSSLGRFSIPKVIIPQTVLSRSQKQSFQVFSVNFTLFQDQPWDHPRATKDWRVTVPAAFASPVTGLVSHMRRAACPRYLKVKYSHFHTGLITTTSRKLDREQQAEHFLEVSAWREAAFITLTFPQLLSPSTGARTWTYVNSGLQNEAISLGQMGGGVGGFCGFLWIHSCAWRVDGGAFAFPESEQMYHLCLDLRPPCR